MYAYVCVRRFLHRDYELKYKIACSVLWALDPFDVLTRSIQLYFVFRQRPRRENINESPLTFLKIFLHSWESFTMLIYGIKFETQETEVDLTINTNDWLDTEGNFGFFFKIQSCRRLSRFVNEKVEIFVWLLLHANVEHFFFTFHYMTAVCGKKQTPNKTFDFLVHLPNVSYEMCTFFRRTKHIIHHLTAKIQSNYQTINKQKALKSLHHFNRNRAELKKRISCTGAVRFVECENLYMCIRKIEKIPILSYLPYVRRYSQRA